MNGRELMEKWPPLPSLASLDEALVVSDAERAADQESAYRLVLRIVERLDKAEPSSGGDLGIDESTGSPYAVEPKQYLPLTDRRGLDRFV